MVVVVAVGALLQINRAAPTGGFSVRYGTGDFRSVQLGPSMTSSEVKEAVAAAVELPVGSFFIRRDGREKFESDRKSSKIKEENK